MDSTVKENVTISLADYEDMAIMVSELEMILQLRRSAKTSYMVTDYIDALLEKYNYHVEGEDNA